MTKFLMALDCDGGGSIARWCMARHGAALLADVLLSAIRMRTGTLTDGMFNGSLANALPIDSWL